ncbi:MAG: hypothetical protein H6Q74_2601 [Firmicutes bacterium]|nr:hypothetical protein [Bacillota bacterium]
MKIDLKKLGVTKRTWGLLIVLAIIVGCYCFTGTPDTANGTPVVLKASVSSDGQASPAKPKAVEKSSVIADLPATSRDPFYAPPAFSQNIKSEVAEKPEVKPVAAMTTTMTPAKPAIKPELQGTASSDSGKAAILTLESQSRLVCIGGKIGEYTLVDVEKDCAVLTGPEGSITLWMKR